MGAVDLLITILLVFLGVAVAAAVAEAGAWLLALAWLGVYKAYCRLRGGRLALAGLVRKRVVCVRHRRG